MTFQDPGPLDVLDFPIDTGMKAGIFPVAADRAHGPKSRPLRVLKDDRRGRLLAKGIVHVTLLRIDSNSGILILRIWSFCTETRNSDMQELPTYR